MQLVAAERRWTGRCIVAASGPSLTEEVAAMIRKERVIAVNDAYWRVMSARVLYSCDQAWWDHHKGCPGFNGEKWTSHSLAPKNDKRAIADKYGLKVIAGVDRPGFSRDSSAIHYGNNSGFQAVNLAILWGADPIVLVGFDMRPIDGKDHFFGNHKSPLSARTQYSVWIASFAKAAKMLGTSPRIINSTPRSALTCFEQMPLERVLEQRVVTGTVAPIHADQLRWPQ